MRARIINMTEEHLIIGCQRKDRRSQQMLYEKYFDLMSMVCYRYVKDQDAAQDLVHEGFLKVFRKIKDFNNQGSLEGWIRRIMVNTCLDYLRRQKRKWAEVNLTEAESQPTDDEVIATLQAEFILNELQQLPETLQMVFNLYIIEGYSHKVVAKMLDINPSTSRAYLTEARKQLKVRLQPHVQSERRIQNG